MIQYSTVGEMKKLLEQFPNDMPIVRKWNCAGDVHVLEIIPDTERR